MKAKTLEEKLQSSYSVSGYSKGVKDVDLTKRTVTGVFNSYFYIDADLDMLLPGAAKKSIQERGVGSNSGNKIKHLKDHNWANVMARLDVLDEREVIINDKALQGIYHESFYPDTTDSNDLLIKIQEGLYDDRSIGFNYVKLVWAEKDSNNEDAVDNWNEFLPMAINPEKAEEAGFFWVVKEIKLWEGSDVAFGANALTPLLGIKSGEKTPLALFEKLDRMQSLMKSGALSDEGFHGLAMEIKQIKSYITAVVSNQPSIKDTLLQDRHERNTEQADKKKLLCI